MIGGDRPKYSSDSENIKFTSFVCAWFLSFYLGPSIIKQDSKYDTGLIKYKPDLSKNLTF